MDTYYYTYFTYNRTWLYDGTTGTRILVYCLQYHIHPLNLEKTGLPVIILYFSANEGLKHNIEMNISM